MDIVIGVTDWMGDTIKYQGTAGNPNVKIAPITHAAQHTAVPQKPSTEQQQQTADILNYVYAQANMMQAILSALPEPAKSYAIYQTYFETGAYQSDLYKLHNNAAGIKFANQKGATRLSSGFAGFTTWQDFANAFVNLLNKGSKPAWSTNLEDYVNALKVNKYFGDESANNYLAGLKRARYVLKDLPATMRAGLAPDGSFQNKNDLDIPGSTNNDKKDWWKELPDWQKGSIVGGGVLLLIVALKG